MGFINSVDFWGLITLFLSILVVFVNGWTDAPNSVFSVVASGTLKLWQGVLLSAVFNFLGVLVFSISGGKVSQSILSLAKFESSNSAKIACLACFLTVIIFGVCAWFFGMPSSESHALIASLAGASLCFGKFNLGYLIQFIKILFFMILSCMASFLISYGTALLLKNKRLPFKHLLIFSCGSLSFMHGAQDGQKFIAIIALLSGAVKKSAPLDIILLVSIIMSISTLLGGKRIIASLSLSIEKCDTPVAFFSDLSSFFTLLLCSFLGMPISTGNVKSMSLVGASVSSKNKINKKMITEILLTSVITFPICFILGYLISKLLSFAF